MVDIITRDVAYKFVKFGIVGFTGVFIDFGFTYICKEWFKIQKYVANAIGFTIAASSNYYLNRIWTFNSHNPEIAVEFGRFFFISLIGLLLSTLVIYLLVSKVKINFTLASCLPLAL